jgi:hypothetical protein
MRTTGMIAASVVVGLGLGSAAYGVASAGSVSTPAQHHQLATGKSPNLSVIARPTIRRRCPAGQTMMVVYKYRACEPGEAPPGGLFGNKCFDTLHQCGVAPVVR